MDVTQSCILPPLSGRDPISVSCGPRSPLARPRATSAPSMVGFDWLERLHSGPHATAVASRASSRASGNSPAHKVVGLPTVVPAPDSPRPESASARRLSKAEQDARVAFKIAPFARAVMEAEGDPVTQRRALFRLGVIAFDYNECQRAEQSWRQAAALPHAEGDLGFIAALKRDAKHPMIAGIVDALDHLCRGASITQVVPEDHVRRELNLVYFRVAEQIQRQNRAEKLDFFAGKDVTPESLQRRDTFLLRIPAVDYLYCKSIDSEPTIATLWLRYCRFADDFFPLLRPNYRPRKSLQACFDMAEHLGPKTANDYADYGLLLKTRGRLEDAKDALSEAVRRKCNNVSHIQEVLRGVEIDTLKKRTALEPAEQLLLTGAGRAATRRRSHLRPVSLPKASTTSDAVATTLRGRAIASRT